MKPKRSEDKYWKGTRNFDHISYEQDLEDYIDEIESHSPSPSPEEVEVDRRVNLMLDCIDEYSRQVDSYVYGLPIPEHKERLFKMAKGILLNTQYGGEGK